MSHANGPEARPIIRWLAGFSAPIFVITALITAFPRLVGNHAQPSYPLAALLLWGGALFVTIAATGKLKRLFSLREQRGIRSPNRHIFCCMSSYRGAGRFHYVALGSLGILTFFSRSAYTACNPAARSGG
jgi:hypothetical protein